LANSDTWDTIIIDLTGTGQTWDEIARVENPGDPSHGGIAFRFMPSSTLTGATVSFAVDSVNFSGEVSIEEYGGVVTTGTNGSDAIPSAKVFTNAIAPGPTSLTVTLSSFADAVNNMAVGIFGDDGTVSPVVGSGFTSIHSANTVYELLVEYKLGQDTSVDYSWSNTDVKVSGIAFEVVAAASFNPANLTVTPSGTTNALAWDASAGAIDYSIFRRTPPTGVPFVPGTDTPIASGVATLSYNDLGLSPATYEYEVFGRLT
jgi:hypothetical protein